jgi:2-oxoacid:acceptor oxidoreductase delta subunit (pyruvate/2-ketoisovalerate family)
VTRMQTLQERHMNKQKNSNLLGPCANDFASSNTGSWRTERPQVDFEKCTKCGMCKMHCPPNVITIDKNSEECVQIMWDYCKGCGICANVCPRKCIAMVNERRGE